MQIARSDLVTLMSGAIPDSARSTYLCVVAAKMIHYTMIVGTLRNSLRSLARRPGKALLFLIIIP